ncbi:hypothetical protein WJX82_006767 [Trebouxia sp. C0006]
MGRPMLKICAKKGCDVTDCTSDPAQQEGVDFSVQVCFFRGLDSSSESQLWACCPEHKDAALQLVLQGMPYRNNQYSPSLESAVDCES